MKRRRFLTIAAAALAVPRGARASVHRWRGTALGAEAELVLHGPRGPAEAVLDQMQAGLRQVEARFSLYDEASELSRLNRDGSLEMSAWFAELVSLSDRVHKATGGLFDPTVQPLWRDLFMGRTGSEAPVGWDRVRVEGARIRLGQGQALTFNGIAQGFATDLVADALKARGFGEILVNIGEVSGHGRDWRIGLSDPTFGHLGSRTLRDRAIATSSPGAMDLAGRSHILHPTGGAPVWSTVSVEAESAALADGVSTALCLANEDMIRAALTRLSGVHRVTTVDHDGNLRTF